MAIPCQGMTLTWGGATLSEVQEFEADQFGGLPLGRTTTWTPEIGTVRLVGFSTANLALSDYGKRKQLTISALAPATPTSTVYIFTTKLVDRDAIYQGYRVAGVANDAVRFAFTFRLMDTVGAPSNP